MIAVLGEVTEVMGNSLQRGCKWRPQRGSDDSARVGGGQVKCESENERECSGRGHKVGKVP